MLLAFRVSSFRSFRNEAALSLVTSNDEDHPGNLLETAACVLVCHSARGTEPKRIVDFAEPEFLETRACERIHAVFDRGCWLRRRNPLLRPGSRTGFALRP